MVRRRGARPTRGASRAGALALLVAGLLTVASPTVTSVVAEPSPEASPGVPPVTSEPSSPPSATPGVVGSSPSDTPVPVGSGTASETPPGAASGADPAPPSTPPDPASTVRPRSSPASRRPRRTQSTATLLRRPRRPIRRPCVRDSSCRAPSSASSTPRASPPSTWTPEQRSRTPPPASGCGCGSRWRQVTGLLLRSPQPSRYGVARGTSPALPSSLTSRVPSTWFRNGGMSQAPTRTPSSPRSVSRSPRTSWPSPSLLGSRRSGASTRWARIRLRRSPLASGRSPRSSSR